MENNFDFGVYPPVEKSPPIYKQLPRPTTLKRKNTPWGWIILTALIISGAFFWLSYEGYFTPVVNQDVQVDPAEVGIDNQYDFNPETKNSFYNNYTIINQLECPACDCENT